MLSEFLANRLGKPPQMLPLRTPECKQGDRQLLPFLLSKPYNKSETNLKILEAIFLDVLPKEILYCKSFLFLIGNLHVGWAP